MYVGLNAAIASGCITKKKLGCIDCQFTLRRLVTFVSTISLPTLKVSRSPILIFNLSATPSSTETGNHPSLYCFSSSPCQLPSITSFSFCSVLLQVRFASLPKPLRPSLFGSSSFETSVFTPSPLTETNLPLMTG